MSAKTSSTALKLRLLAPRLNLKRPASGSGGEEGAKNPKLEPANGSSRSSTSTGSTTGSASWPIAPTAGPKSIAGGGLPQEHEEVVPSQRLEDAGVSSSSISKMKTTASAASSSSIAAAASRDMTPTTSSGSSLYDLLPPPDPEKDEKCNTYMREKNWYASGEMKRIDQPSKVIFLDVDGVLRPVRRTFGVNCVTVDGIQIPLSGGDFEFKSGSLSALRYIREKTGAVLVLSSEWYLCRLFQEHLRVIHSSQLLKQLALIFNSKKYKSKFHFRCRSLSLFLRQSFFFPLVICNTFIFIPKRRRHPSLREDLDRVLKLQRVSPDGIKEQTTTVLERALGTGDPVRSFADRRAREIGEYLRDHPHVEHWVALDDIDLSVADDSPPPPADQVRAKMRGNFIRTDDQRCLSFADAQRAVSILDRLGDEGDELSP
ncbi:unnamed protein product [Amoebophrya sp. A120]|nr:unnamed protein product [Amoebophrya sp. A120]|eukprot:GSA120T00002182001.1